MITLLVLITIITQLFLLLSTGFTSATSLNEDAPPDYIVTTCSPPIDNINLPDHRLVIESLSNNAAELSLANPCPHLQILNSNFKAIYLPSRSRTANKSHTAAVFHNFTLRNVSAGHISIRVNEIPDSEETRIVKIDNRLPTFEVTNVRVNFNMGKNYSQQPEDYSTAFQFLNRKMKDDETGVEFESFIVRDSTFIANTEFSFHAAKVRPNHPDYGRDNDTVASEAMVHLDGIRFADSLSFFNNTLFSTYLALSIDDVIFSNEERSSLVIENNSVTVNDQFCSSRESCTAILGVRVIFAVNRLNRNFDENYVGPATGSSGKTPVEGSTYPPQLSITHNRFVSIAKFAFSRDSGGVRINEISFLPSSSPFSAARGVFVNNNEVFIDHSRANLRLNPVYDTYIEENGTSVTCMGISFLKLYSGSAPLQINNNNITVWKMLVLYGILFQRQVEFAADNSQLDISNNIFDISSNIPALLVSRAQSNTNGFQSSGMAAIRLNLEFKLPTILRVQHNTVVNLTGHRPIFKLDPDPRAAKIDTQIGTPITFLKLISMEGAKHIHVNNNRVSNFGAVADSRYISALTFIEARVKYLKLFTVIETFNCSNNELSVVGGSKAQFFFFFNTEFDLTSVVRPKNLILEYNIVDVKALAFHNCDSCSMFGSLMPDTAELFETQISAFALLLGTVLFEKMRVVNNSFTGTASLAVNPRTGGKGDESGHLRIVFFGSLIQMAQPFPAVSLGKNIEVAIDMTSNNFRILANPLADPLSTKASAFQQSPSFFPLFIFGPYTHPFDRLKTATIEADVKVQDNHVTSEAGAVVLAAVSGMRFSVSGKSSFRMSRNRLVATIADFQKTLDEGSLEAIELSLKPFPVYYQVMQYSTTDAFIHLSWKNAEVPNSNQLGSVLFESVGFDYDDDTTTSTSNNNNNNNNFFFEFTDNLIQYSNAVFSFLVMLQVSHGDTFPMKIDGNQMNVSKFTIPSRFASSSPTTTIVQSGREELIGIQLTNLRGRNSEQQQRRQRPLKILIQNQVATLSATSGEKLVKTNTSKHVFLKIMEYSDSQATSSNDNRIHNSMLKIELKNNTISESNHRSSSLISIGGDLGRVLNSINSIAATANTMVKTFDIDEASFEAVSLVSILPSSSFTSATSSSSNPTSPRISFDSNVVSLHQDRTSGGTNNNNNSLIQRINDQRKDTQKWFGFRIPSEVLNNNNNNNNLGIGTSMIIFNLTSTTLTCNQLRLLMDSSSSSIITLDTNILLENPLVESVIAGAKCETPLPPSSRTQTEANRDDDNDNKSDDFVPPPQPVADALRASQVTESVSMATMAIGAAAVPSLAFTVSRQDSMTSFAKHALDGDCRGLLPRLEKPDDDENFDDAVPLPPSTSPTQMAIGSSRARYLIGAVVGNFILMVGLLLLNIFLGKTLFLFIRARVAAYKLKTLRSSSSRKKDHKTPASSASASSPWYDDAIIQAYVTLTFFFCLSLLLSPTLTSTVILLAGGISNDEVSMGTKIGCLIISLIMSSLGVYFALWSTILRKPDREKFRINEQHQKEMLKNSTSPLSIFKYLFVPDGDWKLPSNNNVTKKQSDQFSLALPAFESNRNTKWFALVEIITAICLSLPPLFAQLPNDGKTSCIVYGSMLSLIFVVYTVLLVWKRPFKLRIMRIMLPLMAIQQTVTVVMVFVNAVLIANSNTNNNNNRNKNGDANSSWLWRVILVPLGFEAFLGVLSIGAAFFPLFMFLKKILKRVNTEVASNSGSNSNKKSKKENLTSLMRDQDEGGLEEEMLSRGGSFAHHHHHHRDRREDKEKNDSGRRSRNQSFHRTTSSSNRNDSFSPPSSSSRLMMRNENEEKRRRDNRDRSADKGRDHHHHHHHRSWQEQQTSTRRKDDDSNNGTTSGHRHRYNNDDENDGRTLLRSPHRDHPHHSSRNTSSRSDRPTSHCDHHHHHHHHSSSSCSGRNERIGTRERSSPSDKSKISPENRAFNNFSFSRSPDLSKMLTPKLSATSPSLPTSVNNNDSKHHYHRRKKENNNDDNERLEFSRRGGKSSQYHDDRRK